jgi:hypothetical protein
MIGLQQKRNQATAKPKSDFEFMLGVLQRHCTFQLERADDELERDDIVNIHYDILCREAT